MRFALIGKGIAHSKSPDIYRALMNKEIDYSLLDCANVKDLGPLKEVLRKYPRVSVTAPHKKACYQLCDHASKLAQEVEAVNALVLGEEEIIGENTDALAVKDILFEDFSDVSQILLLGDGAMARVVKTVAQEKTSLINLSRKLGNLEKINTFVSKLESNSLVLNACSRDYKLEFKSSKSLKIWDLNYSVPHNANFAKQNGHQYIDGEGLLIRQARYALSFWNSYIS